jgi:hypothetical protein
MTEKQPEICYACNNIATSREHVPPKCLFPTELGINLRKALITVPSCEVHNGKKSDDDEFLLASLAGIIGCNDIGLLHKLTKVDRANKRSGGRLLNKVADAGAECNTSTGWSLGQYDASLLPLSSLQSGISS